MRNLLFISHRIAWPLNKGEKIRAWNLIQHLKPHFNIHFGCVVDDPADMAHAARVGAECASFAAFPIDKKKQKYRALLKARPGKPLMPDFYYSRALHEWVDATMARVEIDIVYIYSVAMFPYSTNVKRGTMILDAQDIDSEKWGEYAVNASYPMKLVWAREARTLLAYERQAAAACKWTFFVSQPEASRFIELAPEAAGTSVAVECGVDLARFSPADIYENPFGSDAPCLVFTGNMDYWPNADAAIWFAREIMPLARARVPDIQFWAVGANPGPDVKSLADLPGVFVTGRVEDVRPYVAHAAAIVCPLRIARGIQNKVLEGMAMGKPVIASPPAYEGVRAVSGTELLVADGPAAFVDVICEVLEGKHPELGPRARSAMERGYAWSAVLSGLDNYLAP